MAISNDLARRDEQRALTTEAPTNPWAETGLLKPHAAGLVQEAPRVDALATISAGRKNANGYPERSTDGTIYLHDSGNRAPGLKAALAERDNKGLTIALVSNAVGDVLQQRFSSYSQTRLLGYGDQHQITLIHQVGTGRKDRQGKEIMTGEREAVEKARDPQKYAQLAADMKVQSSLYFALATWDNGQPKLIFPDGLGLYRLRFTSLNSAEAIRGQLAYLSTLTGGKVAGIPLELAIDYREVSGPDGSRRTVPVWTLVLRPPGGLALEAGAVATILSRGIEQAQSLALAAPRAETVDAALVEDPDVDLDDPGVIDGHVISADQVRMARGGGPISNWDRFKTEFFMAAGKSSLRTDEGRQEFMLAYSHGRTGSLREWAQTATNFEGTKLLETVGKFAVAEIEARNERGEPAPVEPPKAARPGARSYDEMFPDDDPQPAPAATPRTVSPQVQAAVAMSGGPANVPTTKPDEPLARPVDGQSYTRKQWVAFYTDHFARLKRMDTHQRPVDIDQLENGALKAAVMAVIAEADDLEEVLATLPDPAADDNAEGGD